jgi:uncharacterized membrane protein
MSWEPQDDLPEGEWIVYDEIGAVIGSYGQDEYRAKEAARACGGRDLGISAHYVEMSR